MIFEYLRSRNARSRNITFINLPLEERKSKNEINSEFLTSNVSFPSLKSVIRHEQSLFAFCQREKRNSCTSFCITGAP